MEVVGQEVGHMKYLRCKAGFDLMVGHDLQPQCHLWVEMDRYKLYDTGVVLARERRMLRD